MSKLFNIEIKKTSSYSEEGIVKAKVGEFTNDLKHMGTEVSGWFKNSDEKKAAVEKKADKLIEWLEIQDEKHENLNLSVGDFETWMKTSHFFRWRYYYLLNESTYREILKDIADGENSKIEDLTSVEISDRKRVTDLLDDLKSIKDLIKIVKTYKERSNNLFTKIKSRQKKIKGAPFQIVLLGLVDLESTIRKIVNIAV